MGRTKNILGRAYERVKKSQGEHTGNQYTMERDHFDPIPTADTLAKQYAVSPATIKRAAADYRLIADKPAG